MKILDAELGTEYIVTKIDTNDKELNNFLFTLGCYEGQKIVVVSKLGKSFVISVLDGRYTIDEELADAILIEKK